MVLQIDMIEFRGRIENTAPTKPEAESSKAEKGVERERLVSAAVAETLAVMRRQEER